MELPVRQIRGQFNKQTIRVYQAYNESIANTALQANKFISPPFKLERMTWIKPSFLWMMYRSGWAKKDLGQTRILAIDICRQGFEWALGNSLLSHNANNYDNKAEWLKIKQRTPVRIQWDPERNLHLVPLQHRAIQIGLTGAAVPKYVNEWTKNISDVTDLAHKVHDLVLAGEFEKAEQYLPVEDPYPVSDQLALHLEMKQLSDID